MEAATAKAVRLADVDFGMSAAENELLERPALLEDGFYNLHDAVDGLLNSQSFLVLGPKGCGKSAIAGRLELLSKKGDFYTRTFMLEDFPYKSFSGVLPGKESHEVRLPRHWEYVLLLALLDNYISDPECSATFSNEDKSFLSELGKGGILPVSDLKTVVKTSSSSAFKVRIPKLVEYSRAGGKEQQMNLNAVHEGLRRLAYQDNTRHRHFIVIDGLDDVLTNSEKQYQAIAALIVAADRINRNLKRAGSLAKVLVLCRQDLFDKLDDPNTNKIRQDHAVELDWYEDEKNPMNTHLVRLVQKRVAASVGPDVDLFADLLPAKAFGKDTMAVLLDNTRHRPRDILHALKYVQRVAKTAKALNSHVESGMKNYATQYFVPEVRNELCGFLSKEDAGYAVKLLQANGKFRFSYSELDRCHKALVHEVGREVDLPALLNALYEVGVLGQTFKPDQDYREFIQFKYRNPHATLNFNNNLILHLALAKGLNIAIG